MADTNKEIIQTETRLMAIEYVLCQIGKIALLATGITPELAGQMRRNARASLLSEAFPGTDPVLADHLSGELADRVEDLLRRIETLVAETYLKAGRSESGT